MMKYFNGYVKDLKGRIINVTEYKAKSKNQMIRELREAGYKVNSKNFVEISNENENIK